MLLCCIILQFSAYSDTLPHTPSQALGSHSWDLVQAWSQRTRPLPGGSQSWNLGHVSVPLTALLPGEFPLKGRWGGLGLSHHSQGDCVSPDFPCK